MIGNKLYKPGKDAGKAPVRLLLILALTLALLAVFLFRRTISGKHGEVSPELDWREVDPLGLFEDPA